MGVQPYILPPAPITAEEADKFGSEAVVISTTVVICNASQNVAEQLAGVVVAGLNSRRIAGVRSAKIVDTTSVHWETIVRKSEAGQSAQIIQTILTAAVAALRHRPGTSVYIVPYGTELVVLSGSAEGNRCVIPVPEPVLLSSKLYMLSPDLNHVSVRTGMVQGRLTLILDYKPSEQLPTRRPWPELLHLLAGPLSEGSVFVTKDGREVPVKIILYLP